MLNKTIPICRNTTLVNIFCKRYSRWTSNDEDYELIHTPSCLNNFGVKDELNSSRQITMPTITSNSIFKTVITSNQSGRFKKLEFLGDAYLEFVITVLLFERFPNLQKKLLVEMMRDLLSNKHLGDLSRQIGLLKGTKSIPQGSKRHADVFEAYFGGIALEAGTTTYFDKRTSNVWEAWNKTTCFMLEKSKDKFMDFADLYASRTNERGCEIEIICGDTIDPLRKITQLRNNRMKDLTDLFNAEPDDYERRFSLERLQVLGNTTLKYFLTKIYSDNLTDYTVKDLANLRDSRMKDSKIISLTGKYLDQPSYSLLYSLFNKNKKKLGFGPNAAIIKQFLGYLVATHYLNSSDKGMRELFLLGWNECESFVKSIYYDDMLKEARNKHRKFRHSKITDPRVLDSSY